MAKKIYLLLILPLLIASAGPSQRASAQNIIEPDSGSILCAPGIYLIPTDDCIPLGPSQALTEAALLALSNPRFKGAPPDGSLADIPYSYFQVDAEQGVSIYPTLGDALGQSGGMILRGARIVASYIDFAQTDQGYFFKTKTGEWITGNGQRIYPQLYRKFQGLEFKSTPKIPFGWALYDANVYRMPAYNDPGNPALRTLERYQVVQILAVENHQDFEWYQIGVDEWVLGIKIGMVTPNTTPPQGVTGDRWVEVDLKEQTLAVYENRRMVFATLVATGREPYWTRPGLFQIYEKKEREDMSGSFTADKSDYYLLQDVPWTMYFDKARALHGAYWESLSWYGGFGYPQSHGCVNLSVGDSHWLYLWSEIGDWIYIHDPSGNTPSDPALFGDGGA